MNKHKAISLIVSGAITALGYGIAWKFPTVPLPLADALTFGPLVVLSGVVIWICGGWVHRRLPAFPWLPDQRLQVGRWLAQRPTVWPISPIVPVIRWESGLMADCQLVFTLSHAIKGRSKVSLLYEDAVLSMAQNAGGRHRRFTFRPVETGGFPAHPIDHLDHNKAFRCVFVWTGLPAAVDRAPDLQAGFEWRLSGIRAIIHGDRELSGRLPALRDHVLSAAEVAKLAQEMPAPLQSSVFT